MANLPVQDEIKKTKTVDEAIERGEVCERLMRNPDFLQYQDMLVYKLNNYKKVLDNTESLNLEPMNELLYIRGTQAFKKALISILKIPESYIKTAGEYKEDRKKREETKTAKPKSGSVPQ